MLTKNHEAIFCNDDVFISFSYGGYNIRIRTLYSLERYVDVVSLDDGDLVILSNIVTILSLR